MKKLPIGIQTFSKLIEENYLYVDKTRDIYNLLTNGSQYYFISRPRRFGKSLLISTLKEIFSGNQKLFKGLWIYDKIDWKRHPVIHIDFLGLNYENREELIDSLNYLINQNANFHQVKLSQEGYDKRFKELIGELSRKNPVVILIDEYDKPIIDVVEKTEIALENRKILRTFYSTIKGADEFIKFAFITGVSKFSRVSVFSGLNNLRDITLSNQFSNMMGYTDDELLRYFSDRIQMFADDTGKSKKELIADIKRWYNGYSWDGENFVYNPFSILNFFTEKQFDNYWFSSGTPTFLTKLIRKERTDATAFDHLHVSGYIFDSYDIDNMEITSLLFQTGYLTIRKKYSKEDSKRYQLSYPNKEVRDSFLNYLFREYTRKDFVASTQIIDRMVDAIAHDDPDTLFQSIQSLFASIPYNIFTGDKESYYHTIIYLVLTLIGIHIQAEVQTNQGRIDAVIETQHHIYIMEFKIGTAEEALQQIKDRKYHQKYLSTGKPLKLIGIGFNPSTRNIQNYQIEEI